MEELDKHRTIILRYRRVTGGYELIRDDGQC